MKRNNTKNNLRNLDKEELVDTLLADVKGGSLSITCINLKCKPKCKVTNPFPRLPTIPGFGI